MKKDLIFQQEGLQVTFYVRVIKKTFFKLKNNNRKRLICMWSASSTFPEVRTTLEALTAHAET